MNYTESAILRVIDQASAPVNKIDSALKRLHSTANSLGSRAIAINVKADNLSQIESRLGRIEGMMRRAFNAPTSFGSGIASQLAGVTSAANAATAAMNRLNSAASTAGRSRNNGWFGRFPENIPGIAARYAGWNAVAASHNVIRAGGRGILDAASERTALAMTGVAVPEELIEGKSKTDAEAISRAYEASVKDAIRKGAGTTASKYLTLTDAGMMDVGRTAIPNLKDPTKVAEAMDTFGASATALALVYKDAEKGMEGARQGYRALDQMGLAGDPKKLESYMKAWTTGIFASGRDVSAHQMANTISRLGGAKMGLSEAALSRIIMLQDEARGQTANLVRTFQNDMVRPDKDPKMQARMIAAGVRTRDGSAAFGEELQSDPQMYILDRIKPLAEKFGYVTERFDAATGKMVEVSDAKKAEQLNRILTQKLGFTSSSKTFALDTLIKEAEIRRNARTIAAQNAKLSPEALRELIWSDPKSAMVAVQSQWKRAADSMTQLAQPIATGGMAVVAGMLSHAANNPSGVYAAAAVGTGAAIWAANNPHIAAMGTAATAHFAAARALTTAAGRLGLSAIGGPGGGLLSGAKKWGGRAVGALGVGAVGYDLLTGNIGNAALGAGVLAAGFASPVLGIAMALAAALDAAFNDGKITGAITGPIDKFVREMFGMKPAQAASPSADLLNKKLAGEAELLKEMDHGIATRKLQLEHRTEGARTKAERASREAELKAAIKSRESQAEVVQKETARETYLRALIEEGNRMKEPGKEGFRSAANRAADMAEPEQTQVTRSHDALGNALTVATNSANNLGTSAGTASSALTGLAEKVSGLFGVSKGDPKSLVYGPPVDTPLAYGPPPGLFDGGGIGIPIDAPELIGEQAAEPIRSAGDDVAMALGGAGSEIERAGSSAGMTLLDYAAQAGQAFLALVQSANINVRTAADHPGTLPNLGGSANTAR